VKSATLFHFLNENETEKSELFFSGPTRSFLSNGVFGSPIESFITFTDRIA
jgi:hypothetical protein